MAGLVLVRLAFIQIGPVLGTRRAGRLEYAEGLLIGYRGYEAAGRAPRFAFGHGLGYTTWEYLSAGADSAAVGPDEDLRLTVTIRNTGSRPGREVVQAYVEPVPPGPGRPGRSPATTRRLAPGSGRPASSRSASAGHRLTCCCPCGSNPYFAERTRVQAGGNASRVRSP